MVPNYTHCTHSVICLLPLLHHPQPSKILFVRSLSTQTRAVRKHKFIVWRTSALSTAQRSGFPRLIMRRRRNLCLIPRQPSSVGLGTGLKYNAELVRAPPTQLCPTCLPPPPRHMSAVWRDWRGFWRIYASGGFSWVSWRSSSLLKYIPSLVPKEVKGEGVGPLVHFIYI